MNNAEKLLANLSDESKQIVDQWLMNDLDLCKQFQDRYNNNVTLENLEEFKEVIKQSLIKRGIDEDNFDFIIDDKIEFIGTFMTANAEYKREILIDRKLQSARRLEVRENDGIENSLALWGF